jgi:hypothetical protein
MGKPGPHLILFKLSLNEVKTKAIQDGNRFEKIMRGKLSVGHSQVNT